MGSTNPPVAEERVLSTLNLDGTRRWMRPKLARGRYYNARLISGWALIILFAILPFIEIGGKPAILLNLPRREFSFFGATFVATDAVVLMLFLLFLFLAIFLVTALLGRVWCGWGCPQTVYMEFLFRPLERLIEGNTAQQRRLDSRPLSLRRLLKYAVFAVFSLLLANVFLSYFVGVEVLFQWVQGSPRQHWAPFVVVAVTAALVFLDFAYFREQMCVVACPYARLQSVLIDRRSLIVAYDPVRGEPRGKVAAQRARQDKGDKAGDCIDCRACVVTCPTGIDIREGLQMECIGCTQCIDACDAIMDEVGQRRGLIRYTSQEALQTRTKPSLWRTRTVLYPVALAVILGLLVVAVEGRSAAEVTVLRGIGAPFVVQADGRVSNQIRVKVFNRTDNDKHFAVSLLELPGGELVAPENPMRVAGNAQRATGMFVLSPSSLFVNGKRGVIIRVSDSEGFNKDSRYELLGPK